MSDPGKHQLIAEPNTILRGQVGSGLHGVTTGADDRDEMGVCIEPRGCVIGLDQFEQWQWRTQPEGVRSGPGDLDLVVYSLRKWTRLAAQGNPTVLLLGFIPNDELVLCNEFGQSLRDNMGMFLSKQAAARFIGYCDSQYKQLTGEKSRKHTNRPELVEQYGYDCYLDDTEFLAARGWLTYDEIDDADHLATINQVTGQMEFQQPVERIAKDYSGPILTSKTRNSAWAVTPNHRMLVSKMQRGPSGVNARAYDAEKALWAFRPAANVTRLDWHQRVAAAPRSSEYPVTDPYLALVGAYVSEGTVGKRLTDGSASVLRFEQKDGGRLFATMDLAATEFKFRTYHYPERRPVTVWTLADRTVANELDKECGKGSVNKRLPSWSMNLSARQADVLIDALVSGDGTPHRAGGWVYYTNSPRLADDVQALALGAGRRSNVMGPYDGMYQVRVHDRGDEFAAFRGRDVGTVNVEDRRIVCFTVPNETLVTRRDGKVAMHGNTKFAYHAIRLGVQGREYLTTGRITLPMPEPWRTYLTGLRLGEVEYAEALLRIREQLDALRKLESESDLPDRPDMDRINAWLIDMYQGWWTR